MTGRKKWDKLVLIGTFLVLSLLAACGEVTPTNDVKQLLINEVYTNSVDSETSGIQWIELLNNSGTDLSLAGYKIETAYGSIDLGTLAGAPITAGLLPRARTVVVSNNPQLVNDTMYKLLQDAEPNEENKPKIARPPLPINENKVMGKLNPQSDLVVLKASDGTILDQVGWNNPEQALRTQLGVTTDINLGLGSPNNVDKSVGRTAQFGQTDFVINPGQFTIHNTPTPSTNTTPRTATSKGLFFTTFTDAVTTIGAILLWLAFVLIALVARRFETLSEQKTYWQYLMAAPVGILLYAIIQVQDFVRTGSLSVFWSWPAFLFLFLSGLACLYVINIFRLIARNILEAE